MVDPDDREISLPVQTSSSESLWFDNAPWLQGEILLTGILRSDSLPRLWKKEDL
jgi:hypothetical protein